MEDVRNDSSNDRGNTSASDNSGIAISDGGGVRANAGIERNIAQRNSNTKGGTISNGEHAAIGVTGNASVEITSGFYYTPRGTIERIPDGHYISDSGKLRKRRVSRSDSSNADGNAHRDRSNAGRNKEESATADFLLEKPLNVRGGRKRKVSTKQETSKLTMVTLLSGGAAAIFTSISLLTKHDHWNLEKTEGKILAEALVDAINTLPEKYYAQVIGIIENWIPWINLCFVVGAIVIPRIEASAKRVEKRYNVESKASNSGNAGTEDNPFRDLSSIGYDQR